MEWNLGCRGSCYCICIWSTFDLLVFKVTLWSFSTLDSIWPMARKWLVVEKKGMKFGTQKLGGGGLLGGIVVKSIWGTFDLLVLQVIWGVIQCTCLNISCDSKSARCRTNGVKCRTQGGTFYLTVIRSFGGHSAKLPVTRFWYWIIWGNGTSKC